MKRSSFIKISSFSAGGWMLAQMIPFKSLAGATDPTCFQPSALIKLCDDGKIYIYVIKQESGQGVFTSLPMILAEELEADPKDIVVEAMPFDAGKADDYGTGGSTSVLTQYMPLRKAGATAREMLIAAAAQQWNIPASQCKADRSRIIDTVSGKELAYAQLYAKAAKMVMPNDPPLKNYKDFKIIGKTGQKKTNIKNIVTGKYNFGIDVKLPGMVYASVIRCPVYEGKIKSWDAGSVKHIGGIIKLVEMKEMGVNNRSGVGIIASSRWAAFKASEELKVEWNLGGNAEKSSATYAAEMKSLLLKKPDILIDGKGKPAEFLPKTVPEKTISANYSFPFLAHATMEPVNCTAQFKEGKFELWGGFQMPGGIVKDASRYFKIKPTDIFINLQPMGGGFGRKLASDFGAEAMQLATHTDGYPVQLLYTRQEDIQFGLFRPASEHSISAEVNSEGMPLNWEHRVAISPVEDFQGGNKNEPGPLRSEMGGGLDGDMYYDIPNIRAAASRALSPLPLCWWRAVNFTYHNYVIESFVDELAQHAKKDPLKYRLALLATMPITKISGVDYNPKRLEVVLKEAAAMIKWNASRPAGRGVGIACCFYNHAMAYTAHAFDVSVNAQKKITIHKAVCVTDVGTVIDPDGLENQLQGSLVWGLSEALKSEITFLNGSVEQNSFLEFEVIQMNEIPPYEIKVISSTEPPGGAGETSVPSVKPALCNAIAAASGQRIRALPLNKLGFTLV